ncbi:MAG: hypothetical protein F7B18_08695 [Desulfurococcales archaeon]|nr:hypothetical protein [Desulfurococcales archaeon]
MPRRLFSVNSIPEFSIIDEPTLGFGSLYLSLRRMIALGLAASMAYLLAARGPLLFIATGGVPVTLGALAALVATAGLVALGWQEPKPLPAETQLLLTRPPRRPAKRHEHAEDYTLTADRDLGVARVELLGYALDPATMQPLQEVLVVVDGRVYDVEVSGDGRYRLSLELPRGVHQVSVRAGNVELRRLVIRVT